MTPLLVITALTSLNQLLMTPPGQKLLDLNVELFGKLFGLLHLHLASTLPPSSTPISK